MREHVKKIAHKRRTRRSASPLERIVRNHVNQVDELEKFSEDEQMSDSGIDYMKNRDYAFDTTDTDRFNEDDDLLQRYYNRPVRRAANNDYDSFSDIMCLVGGEGDRDDPFVKRLHYGNDDSFLNDESNNGNDTDEFNAEYDEYDDY